MTTRFLTVGQVCDLLQLSEVSVRRKIRDAEIPAIRLATEGRGAIRVPTDGLDRSLNSRRVTPTHPDT